MYMCILRTGQKIAESARRDSAIAKTKRREKDANDSFVHRSVSLHEEPRVKYASLSRNLTELNKREHSLE